MKRPSIHDIVYSRQFPKPRSNDPSTFYYHMQRNLVPEVRLEVQTYYGALDTLEAQYPGLDYSYEPHRRRLARFQWHRRLFRVFDELNLTRDEILSICQWEGTKSAKEKYEAETGRRIKDTTLDDITAIEPSAPHAVSFDNTGQDLARSEVTAAALSLKELSCSTIQRQAVNDNIGSVGAELHGQLMSAANGAIPEDGPLDEWLKYMSGREEDREAVIQAIRAGHPPPSTLPSYHPNNSTYNLHDTDRMASVAAFIDRSRRQFGDSMEDVRTQMQGEIQA